MKKFYLLFAFTFYSFFANAQNPDAFIMTWENPNQPNFPFSVTIPIVQDNNNNYTVDFGDGTVLTNQTGPVNHIYNSGSIYTISITGVFKQIKFSTLGWFDLQKFKTIEQWGTNQWTSMEGAFYGCLNL